MFKLHTNISWVQLAIYVGGVMAAWAVLQGTIPEPLHDKVAAILLAVSTFVAFILKGGKDPNPPKP